MKKLLLTSAACTILALPWYPKPLLAGAFHPMRSCGWSITAACAALRNGGSYTRDGITHVFAGRHPNGAMRVHVYRGNVRVK